MKYIKTLLLILIIFSINIWTVKAENNSENYNCTNKEISPSTANSACLCKWIYNKYGSDMDLDMVHIYFDENDLGGTPIILHDTNKGECKTDDYGNDDCKYIIIKGGIKLGDSENGLINYYEENQYDDYTGLVRIKILTKTPTYIVFRHKINSRSEGLYGTNNEAEAKKFNEESNKNTQTFSQLLEDHTYDSYCKDGGSSPKTSDNKISGKYSDPNRSSRLTKMCNTIFGDKKDSGSLWAILNEIMTYIRIIVPLIAIAYGTIDLARATIAKNEDEMKKAQKTFIKRILIAVAFFFIPTVINIIISIINTVQLGEFGIPDCTL